jgi:hypothetical protein
VKQQEMQESPDTVDKRESETQTQLIRRVPETYTWFSVGYRYFLQTKWTTKANQRWTFTRTSPSWFQFPDKY